MNKRELKLSKYGISGKRYKELCGFCEQYPEWKQKLAYDSFQYSSPQVTDMPLPPHKNSDKVGDQAVKLAELQHKCTMIEETAKEASMLFDKYLIRGICYGIPVTYLIQVDGMPLSQSAYYEARKYFFFLLDKKKY